jgi:hypothetical protein
MLERMPGWRSPVRLKALKLSALCQLVARNHRNRDIMATATQLVLTQKFDTKKQSPASRQFPVVLRQNIAGQNEEAAVQEVRLQCCLLTVTVHTTVLTISNKDYILFSSRPAYAI